VATVRSRLAAFAVALLCPTLLGAQVIDLTVHDVGLAIGDKPKMTGLRINYRDRELEEVTGVNVTIWMPYDPATGTVNGLALGLPATGARTINGVALAPIGLGTERQLTGVGIGGIGVGSGGELRGIMLGGIGVGSAQGLVGFSAGGVGVGSGGSVKGIALGGIGVGSGNDITGLVVGGIGVGGAHDMTGIAIGGIGAGVGGSLKGIALGGVGVGAASNLTGVAIGAVGVGAGGTIKGLAIGGVGVGGSQIDGVALSLVGAGAMNAHAIVLTGAYFKIADGGRFDGGALAAVNNVQGGQHGLTIGLFNYARSLDGVQLGLINISDNDGHRRILPLLSVR
jgi:hypothetical protein